MIRRSSTVTSIVALAPALAVLSSGTSRVKSQPILQSDSRSDGGTIRHAQKTRTLVRRPRGPAFNWGAYGGADKPVRPVESVAAVIAGLRDQQGGTAQSG